jgi:hypothetical protein
MFFHFTRPVARSYYQRSVPRKLKNANDEIIENWMKIHEVKKLLKAYDVSV